MVDTDMNFDPDLLDQFMGAVDDGMDCSEK